MAIKLTKIIDNWFERHSDDIIWYCCKNPEGVKYATVSCGEVYVFYGEQVLHVSEDAITKVQVVNGERAIVIFTNLDPTDVMLPNVFVFSLDADFSYFDWKKAPFAKKKSNEEDDIANIDEDIAKEKHIQEILDTAGDYMDIYDFDEIRIVRCAECGEPNFFTYRHDFFTYRHD